MMKDRDGKKQLYQISEVPNSELEKVGDINLPTDKQIIAQHEGHEVPDSPLSSDSDSEYGDEHSPQSYGGSQYTSDKEINEHVGLMQETDDEYGSEFNEYTLSQPTECFAAAREDSENESETEQDEVVLHLNYGEYFCSISEQKGGGFVASVEPRPIKPPRTGKHPERSTAEKRCLAAWVVLNGVKGFALFDSGSTADVVSPDFARVARMRIYQLENPLTLQLGTKGSQS
ncbi:hypothetical protein PQX77_002103 [Marasmius sp. AFHP31]|nr:hypothetical protein PQX77_002103 [Marasmius sp. AFHP31]